MQTEIVELEGHIIESFLLSKVLDAILASGADYELLDVKVGRTTADLSQARIEVRASDDDALERLLSELQVHGTNRTRLGAAETAPADKDGVFPPGFYSTTNLPTSVRIHDKWMVVENPEMDCALVVANDGRVRTVPMHRVKADDNIVIGQDGIRVELPMRSAVPDNTFEFMNSDISPEKPKGLIVTNVAQRIRRVKSGGHPGGATKVLAVCGPAVIHTGAGPSLAKLVRDGWIDVLFAGNGFATHDIESNVLGTSLGISVREGVGTDGGHANHLRVINEVRRFGSIAAAVEGGYIEGGVMYECVKQNVPFVLAGSIRDDGPLPDVQVNMIEAADSMRHFVPDLALALMFSSTLHAIATGNILPAGVETFCIDLNQSVMTKLGDRGSHQAKGIVTDVGLFIHALANQLVDRGDMGD